MEIDPEPPRVVKYSPEIGQPVGRGGRWPVWLLLLLLVVLVVFVAWTQGVKPSAAPSPSPTAGALSRSPAPDALLTNHIGRLSITHPASWTLTDGPEAVAGGSVPLFYLSNVALAVPSCPTPDRATQAFAGCPLPVARLPDDGVLVAVAPNRGLAALVPPSVIVEPVEAGCGAIGGTEQVLSVVGSVVVTGCLRGPDLGASTAALRAAIASIEGAF